MTLVRLIALPMVGVAAACMNSSTSPRNTPPPGATVVTIQDFSYTPSAVTITTGHTVFWANNGPSPHTTTSDNGLWDSGTLAPPGSGYSYGSSGSAGGTYTLTFNTPGTYGYHCTIHPPSSYPGFRGTITVLQ